MNRTHATISALLACALALQPMRVFAGDDEAKAKALFDEARALVKKGQWAEACEKLAASKKLVPKMLTIYRLADCHEHVGKMASAQAGFLEAAELAKSTGDTAKREDALDRAKKVEASLSRIALELPKEPGIAIAIDGNKIAAPLLHEKLPLDPGPHTLVASAEGKAEQTVTFTVPAGPSTTTVTVPELAAGAATPTQTKPVVDDVPPPPPAPEAPPSNATRTWGFVALGVGVVGLGVGSFLGLSAKSLDKDAQALCSDRGCTPEGKKLNDDARSRGNLATVVFGVGAAVAITGVVLVIVSPSKKSQTTATVAPLVSAEGAGFRFEGRF